MSQANEIERAERIDVHQDRQGEDKVGYVGRRPVPHEPDVPILALDVRVYRGERPTVAPLWTSRGGAEAEVAYVVVVYERDKRDRDEDDTMQYPSWRELERGGYAAMAHDELTPKPKKKRKRSVQTHTHEVFPSRQIGRYEHAPCDESGKKDPIRPEGTREREPDGRKEPLPARAGPHAPVRTVREERLAVWRELQRGGAARYQGECSGQERGRRRTEMVE